MANIVSSVYAAEVQRDGRKQVHEVHTDLVGVLHDVSYLAGSSDDLAANLTAHALSVGLALGTAEIGANIAMILTSGSLAAPTFVYSTAAQNASALRLAYAVSVRAEAIMIGDFLNTLSSAQLQAAFGITAGQVTTLKTNTLGPAATAAATIRAAAGQ